MFDYDRLSAQDASFLYAESPVAHMHVGSLIVAEDGGFSEQEFTDHINSRLHFVPRFRKKLAWVPYSQGRPVWIDDPHFDIRFHVRYTGLPKPGGMDEALRLMGRIMSIPLDRARPLWELWVFDLPDGRKGMIQKTHHCLIDGISGVDLGTVLLDMGPEPAPTKAPEWTPAPAPSGWQLLADTWRDRAQRMSHPVGFVQTVREALDRSETWDKIEEATQGLVTLGRTALERAPDTSLNVPIGAHRRFDVVRADLGDIKTIKQCHDCKVNDVVLAAVGGGLRRILAARGDDPDGLVLKIAVPVSVRTKAQRGTYGNQVSLMTADLPVGESDHILRLKQIAQDTAGKKEAKQAAGADFFVKLMEYSPPTVLSLAARAVGFQRMVNLVVTNVPGPQMPLYLLGGKLIEGFPYVPLIGSMAVGVAVLSYDGKLNFGLTGDWDAVPDLHLFGEGITATIDELKAGCS